MARYFTKASLYQAVNKIKNQFSLDSPEFKEDFVIACSHISGLQVVTTPFKTQGLRAMANLAKYDDEDDIIILNSNRSPEEQKFSCGHELFHLLWHRNEKRRSFRCFEKIRPGQDAILEWHANEGAAELFVPYSDFIPFFSKKFDYLKRHPDEWYDIYYDLAQAYGVTQMVIENRIENLRYEIDQYRNGIPLERLDIQSKRQQTAHDITTTNYNAYCAFGFEEMSVPPIIPNNHKIEQAPQSNFQIKPHQITTPLSFEKIAELDKALERWEEHWLYPMGL